MKTVVTGSLVRFKSLEDCQKAMWGRGGWNDDMTDIVNTQGSEPFEITKVLNHNCKFMGGGTWAWYADCFDVVTDDDTGYRQFKSGDVVHRNCRFTDTFVKGESHVVDRISSCGYYMHVKGHRHKVPMRYFQIATVFQEGDRISASRNGITSGITWTVNDVKDNGTKFRKAENLGQGFLSTYGYVLVRRVPELTTFEPTPIPQEPVDSSEPANPIGDSYAVIMEAIEAGKAIQYWFAGDWTDVCKNKLTVGQLARVQVRVKPQTVDYYGTELEQPLNVSTWSQTPVYGVSFHKGEVFPCSLGVARKNQMSGSGKYWATEEQAKKVRDTILKPFGVK